VVFVDLSICIVSYNTQESLEECLGSIFERKAGIAIEVIVVDNASSDGTVEMVTSQFPQVHLVANRQNLFFARANNQALRMAEGRYVLILNSDTVVLDGTLEGMVSFMDDHPRVGAATCLLLDSAGEPSTRFWSFHTFRGLVKALYPWQLLSKPHAHNASPRQIDEDRFAQVVTDAFKVARREALQAIGFYDERFFLYYTDDDVCRRLHDAGWKVFYVGSVRGVHKGAQSTRQFPRLSMRRIAVKDMLHYAEKYHGFLAVVALSVLACVDLAVVALIRGGRAIANSLISGYGR
jgi:N-acetylglucosaminyl-diphospho-decaprenol L-rhamnosyltransferase